MPLANKLLDKGKNHAAAELALRRIYCNGCRESRYGSCDTAAVPHNHMKDAWRSEGVFVQKVGVATSHAFVVGLQVKQASLLSAVLGLNIAFVGIGEEPLLPSRRLSVVPVRYASMLSQKVSQCEVATETFLVIS